jgi:shikimate kinase
LPQMTQEKVFASAPAGERRGSFAPGAGGSSLLAVALVGFMGAGKTTVGRVLAERLSWRFADLDDLIQAREGHSVEQIFREQGEAGFRKLERLMVREVASAKEPAPLVLALGGGAFPEEAVQEVLREAGIPAVFLDAPVEELFRRSEQPDVVRPLRRDREQFRELCERRRPAYLKAHLRIETGGREIAAIVEEIVARLKLAPRAGGMAE